MRCLHGYETFEQFPNLFDGWLSRLHPEDSQRAVQAFVEHVADKDHSTLPTASGTATMSIAGSEAKVRPSEAATARPCVLWGQLQTCTPSAGSAGEASCARLRNVSIKRCMKISLS